MDDSCNYLKKELEKSFSMPFEVVTNTEDGERYYICWPQNDEQIYFELSVVIRDDIRLILEIKPQKYAGGILKDIALVADYKKQIFFQYLDLLHQEKAKTTLLVNNELFRPDSPWPSTWKFFSFRIDLIPIPDINSEKERLNLIRDWLKHGISLILSLLTIEETLNGLDISSQPEGTVKEIISKRYERSPINRAICLAHKGYSCSVCGFNFLEQYGNIGKDFIEVHHTTPVSKMGDDYQINIDRDLAPVCSNCHSMLHRKDPPYTIEELQDILSKAATPKQKVQKPAKEAQLVAKGTVITDVYDDEDLRKLIHNMMEIDGGTKMKNIYSVCMKQFQEKYGNMHPKDWYHLINDYIEKVTGKTNLKEDDIVFWKAV